MEEKERGGKKLVKLYEAFAINTKVIRKLLFTRETSTGRINENCGTQRLHL